MTCEPVPQQLTGQSLIYKALEATPYSPSWWVTQTVSAIPGDSVGWLVAQGWQITNVTYDTTTVPPTPTYTLTRNSLQNWIILQSLLESYVEAKNTADTNTTVRYNDIVLSWAQMLDTSHDQFDEQSEEQSTHETLYIGNLGTYMNEVDGLIEMNQAQLVLASSEATAKLEEMHARLEDLETNVTASTAQIEDLLTTQDGYLTTFLSSLGAKLADLDADYEAHLIDIEEILTQVDSELAEFVADQTERLGTLQNEYTTHSDLSATFLLDLGTTELARINEHFAATLSAQLQGLTDRGLYSSAVAADIQARNTRDRDEQIQALNDRLMREKLENEHNLYGQQVAMRDRIIAGSDRVHSSEQEVFRGNAGQRDRLFDQLLQIESQHLAGIDRQNATSQDVSRVTMAERERLLGFLQDALNGVMSGKERYSQLTLQQAAILADQKHQAIAEKMNEYATRLAGLQAKHDECMRLMAYQLDERNKILVGLYGFVERRDDVPPNFDSLVQLATGLGDAGGGWVTP